MAGMETIEVLSKSYLVRWIYVKADHTISWSLRSHKKSLDFGIFKHPGGNTLPGSSIASAIPGESQLQIPVDDKQSKTDDKHERSVTAKLERLGMKCVYWTGKCEADKVCMGKHDVIEGQDGMYGLVFDNTFSKQFSKTATFVLMTYQTNAPPISGHQLHFSHTSATTSAMSLPKTKNSPALVSASDSTSSLHQDLQSVAQDSKSRGRHANEKKASTGATFYTGVLHKRRRKTHNSYARRFFSLDFTTSTLSYYRNRHSAALRGAIPLSLAAISIDDSKREISVDSGVEVWHLRSNDSNDFNHWCDALDKASRASNTMSSWESAAPISGESITSAHHTSIEAQQEWAKVETLVGQLSGIRDAVRRLATDTDAENRLVPRSCNSNGLKPESSPSRSVSDQTLESPRDDNSTRAKRPFWKRAATATISPANFKRPLSAHTNAPLNLDAPGSKLNDRPRGSRLSHVPVGNQDAIHDNCMDVWKDLDAVLASFSDLIMQVKRRRRPQALAGRRCDESASEDEFFDAEDHAAPRSQLLEIRHESHEMGEADSFFDGGSDTSVEVDELNHNPAERKTIDDGTAIFPSRAVSLSPLPQNPITRRASVPPPKQSPPSLISFLRKNVGKDLSTIAMPVTANEPLSALQRIVEQLEHSELLDAAAAEQDAVLRLLTVAAFAVSSFSSYRVKERAVRKPFNPMLGETFELVREDKGFRLLAEKISHHPVRMALQAESKDWTFLQSPMPVQKFWGKSAELNTDGRVRILLHSHGETYSYTLATSFLRNVIAGEKYIEPVSTMTIINETSGAKAAVAFKAGGMFAGRSEEVSIQVIESHGVTSCHGAAGKWTSHLQLTSNGQDSGVSLWKAGALVDSSPSRYGHTVFATQMNEITAIEQGKLPATDSRLRPDQRALENGETDRAEELKGRLEEKQRVRRRAMEQRGEEWKPHWFFKAGTDGSEAVWRLKSGKDNYWEARQGGDWHDVVDIFET